MGNFLAVGTWQADKCKTAKMQLMEKGILIIRIRMGKVGWDIFRSTDEFKNDRRGNKTLELQDMHFKMQHGLKIFYVKQKELSLWPYGSSPVRPRFWGSRALS